jgi:hypothetical protein
VPQAKSSGGKRIFIPREYFKVADVVERPVAEVVL